MKGLPCFFFLLTIVCVTAISCNEGSNETTTQEETLKDTTALYGNRNFVLPELSPTARDVIAQWSLYEDFENEVKLLNGNTVEALRDKTERLIAHTDSLSKKIPDSLFSNPIFSRLIIVKTRVGLLHQEIRKSRLDSAKIQESLYEMNVSVENLVIQINEKFQKEAIDLQRKENEEKELEKQQRFLDSVYQIELQDKKNESL